MSPQRMSVQTGGQSDDNDVRLLSLMRKQPSLLQPTTARFPLTAHVWLKKKFLAQEGKRLISPHRLPPKSAYF